MKIHSIVISIISLLATANISWAGGAGVGTPIDRNPDGYIGLTCGISRNGKIVKTLSISGTYNNSSNKMFDLNAYTMVRDTTTYIPTDIIAFPERGIRGVIDAETRQVQFKIQVLKDVHILTFLKDSHFEAWIKGSTFKAKYTLLTGSPKDSYRFVTCDTRFLPLDR